jgi:hypothetical protein
MEQISLENLVVTQLAKKFLTIYLNGKKPLLVIYIPLHWFKCVRDCSTFIMWVYKL